MGISMFQNNGPSDIVFIPFGTTADTVKIHFIAERPNCKMQVTISIIGCFVSACEYFLFLFTIMRFYKITSQNFFFKLSILD